jgi:hypothetical protein
MNSLVLELQRDALNDNVPVSNLLRKAMVISRKLRIAELEKWTNQELDGYADPEMIPEYRVVRGETKSFNPYNGVWMPIMFSGDAPEGFSKRSSVQSIPEIEDLVAHSRGSGTMQMNFSPDATAALMRACPELLRPPVTFISKSALVGIIAKVRTLILGWTLKLEQEGILGNDMTFTRNEIENANVKRDIIIQNFQGVLGNVSNSTVSQELRMDVRRGDLASLEHALGEKGVGATDIKELKDAIASDPKPAERNKFGERVSGWMGKMLQKAASGAWEIGIGAAGNVLGDALSKYYGF